MRVAVRKFSSDSRPCLEVSLGEEEEELLSREEVETLIAELRIAADIVWPQGEKGEK